MQIAGFVRPEGAASVAASMRAAVPSRERLARGGALVDAQGQPVSGATRAALDAYEAAAAAFRAWRRGAEPLLAGALDDAPAFVMAHLLRAWPLLCTRDPASVAAARPVFARAGALPCNAREALHLAAIGAVLDDDYDRAMATLATLLRAHPRDLLALQVLHSFDYLTGETEALHRRVAQVLPEWHARVPGYHALLAMQAFGLQECGDFDRAAAGATAALALEPRDARACHAIAHVFEMSGRPAQGLHWMARHVASWSGETLVAAHAWWHVALFRLALGEVDRVVALYDARLRGAGDVSTLIDAAALLWRLELHGVDAGARWRELAAAWAPHLDDRFCSFSDLDAMLAFVGAGDETRSQALLGGLEQSRRGQGRHADTTRQLGLPACRALRAFGQGDDRRTIAWLAGLPAQAFRLGGSQAQRDVLSLTLQHALRRALPMATAAPARQREATTAAV